MGIQLGIGTPCVYYLPTILLAYRHDEQKMAALPNAKKPRGG